MTERSEVAAKPMRGHGNPQVIVYTKPACPQCVATKKWLDGKGVAYTARDVTVDEDARAEVLALGYTAAPVVVVGTEHWSGFRLDRLKGLVSGTRRAVVQRGTIT